MGDKNIVFTIPLQLSESTRDFYIQVDDGRLFKITLPVYIGSGENVYARVEGTAMYLPDRMDECTSDSQPAMLQVGSIFDDNTDDLLVPATTISESEVSTPSIFEAVYSHPTVVELMNEAKKIDEVYKVSERVKHVSDSVSEAVGNVDQKYHVSENVKYAAHVVVEKTREADAKYKVSENVKNIDEKYRVSGTVEETIAKTSAAIRTLDENYHVTEAIKHAESHVRDTLQSAAEIMTQEIQHLSRDWNGEHTAPVEVVEVEEVELNP